MKNKNENKKLKECKFCKNKSLEIEFLGRNPDTGAKLFSVVCQKGCTDYIYSFNPETREYMRSGNLNQN